MPRLIDADVLMPNAKYKGKYDIVNAYDIVNCPTVDAVEVVRCKDCRFNLLPPSSGNADCQILYGMTDQNGFCSYGERKEDEQLER